MADTHRWFHPYRGSDPRCRSCGLWAAMDGGDPCPGERDWPQPQATVSWYDDLALPEAGGQTTRPAEVRLTRLPAGDFMVTIERWLPSDEEEARIGRQLARLRPSLLPTAELEEGPDG
jgi:hypothetical protein